jgi:hypothetical protein
MSIEKEILKIYEEITNSKKLVKEVVDTYDNVNFKDGVVGSSAPSKDNINPSLLSDIQIAAKNAGVTVDITTAVSGHGEKTKSGNISRHPSGNAVDIAIIDGRAVSPYNRSVVNKFVDELVKLGYVKNSESGNPKAVLTFGVPGHDNHIHISNTTIGSSTNNPSEVAYDYATSDQSTNKLIPKYAAVVDETYDTSRLQEQRNFGKNVSNRYGRVIIPKENNQKIKSPISGKINNGKYFSNCKNQVTIENNDNNKVFLQFCGISNPSVRNGQSVSIGDVLGETDSDVEVLMYDSRWNRVNIPDKDLKIDKKDKEGIESIKKKGVEPEYYDPVTAAIFGLPLTLFQDKYDESGNRVEKRYGGVADKKEVDPWVLNFLKDPFNRKKVNENINKIKNML